MSNVRRLCGLEGTRMGIKLAVTGGMGLQQGRHSILFMETDIIIWNMSKGDK